MRTWNFMFFFFQAEDGIRDLTVTGVQTCALPIYREDAVRELHGEVLRAHPGDVHVDDELGVRLVDVGGGLPLGRGDEADGAAVRHLVEVDLELLGEVDGETAGAPGGPAAGA